MIKNIFLMAIGAALLTIAIFVIPPLYRGVQEHALQFFWTSAVSAFFAAIMGGLVFWRMRGVATMENVAKKANDLGIKLEDINTKIDELRGAIADARREASEAATNAAAKADDLANKLAEVKDLVTPPAKATASPRARAPKPRKL